MKPAILLILIITSAATITNAQDRRSPFRKGYTRLGIQTIGSALDHSLTPGDNVLKGRLGAGIGFVLERGRIFYFIPPAKAKFINAGIDWTIFSVTVNPLGKAWKSYIEKNSSQYSADEIYSRITASAATKPGFTVSVNPVQDLVVDVRAQAAFSAYLLGPVYESYASEGDADPVNAFFPSENNEEATGIKMYTQMFATGVRTNIGATVRWRSIGIAADYTPGELNMKYNRTDNGVETTGKASIPLSSMQVKLSLTF